MADADATSTVQAVKPVEVSVPQEQQNGTTANVQLKIGNFKNLQAERKTVTKDVLMADADNKHNPLQSEDSTKKSKLVKLDEWKEDAEMKDDANTEKPDDADEEVDPLDAFMNGLDSNANTADTSTAKRGEAMFGEDAEPDFEPVADDLLSFMPKKKKKEIATVDHSKMSCEYLPSSRRIQY
jgi:hypothetical protein